VFSLVQYFVTVYFYFLSSFFTTQSYKQENIELESETKKFIKNVKATHTSSERVILILCST
jgi:hypothetical protein